MKTALIRPQCGRRDEEMGEPLGIEYLGGLLYAEGLDVRLFDQRLYQSRKAFAAALMEYAPDIAGFSMMTGDDLQESLRTMFDLREFSPSVTLVAGGRFITANAGKINGEFTARFPRGTVFLPYESEASLLALCKGHEVPDFLSPEVLPPERWPRPLRQDWRVYRAMGLPLNVQASRGCPGACAFCGTPRQPVHNWRGRSGAGIKAELDEYTGEGPLDVQFVDDDALGPAALNRAYELAGAMRDIPGRFSMQIRPQALLVPGMTEAINAMREAGLWRIFVGVENLDAETLRSWNKPFDTAAVLDKLAECRGVLIALGYIMWHRDVNLAAMKRDIKTLYAYGFFTFKTALSRLRLFPGTLIWERYAGVLTGGDWQFADAAAAEAYTRLQAALLPYENEWNALAVKRLRMDYTGEGCADARRYAGLNELAYQTLSEILC
jgi:radical SAM superfamily enzyme YgiQ (UPF0313 family)